MQRKNQLSATACPPHTEVRWRARWVAVATGMLTFVPGNAAAQSDVERPLPNVMLLVDTSGSMEFRSADNELPTCNPGDPNATNERSRWIDLVEVMTGTLSGYSCFAQDRSSDAFRDEYTINNVAPYDFGYVNPFNRAISNGCTVGPGVLPDVNAPHQWPARGVNTFQFSAPATVVRPTNLATHDGCAGFTQASDGILDVFKEKVRFGLMTFDSHTNAGTGLTEAGAMDVAGGMAGTWSYFIDEPVQGKPADCETLQTQEVGARNSAAPPWEGRMVNFGAPNANTAELNLKNEHIQDVLLATRPYGATPIAGMMHDARDFFWYDQSSDPLNTDEDFGPFDDPATKATDCRRSMIILLSDGEPNLDLRPHCEGGAETTVAGICPYDKPEEIAAQLLSPPAPQDPDQHVETVVIGFALNEVTPAGETQMPCSALTEEQCNSTENQSNRGVMACCTLNKIAAAGRDPNSDGSPRTAYFPQNSTDLRRTFSQVLKDVTVNLTTRTSAVFASAGAGANGGSHQFSSSFVPLVEEPWAGNLTRTRILCVDGAPEAQDVDEDEGDDFAANVNSGAGPARRFVTFLPSSGSDAGETLRPRITSDVDGIGVSNGSQTDALQATSFVSAVSAADMEIGDEDCELGIAGQCKDAILGWNVGLTNAEGETRCATAGSNCNVFGAIYHSTPRLVPGRPNEFLRDESYAAFSREQMGKERPSVLYVATIDGQLHAMKTAPLVPDPDNDVNSKANNELWSFFPPAVLPVLQSQYPNTPATILDGSIQVRDVPARAVGGNVNYERTRADAQEGGGDWSTVLLSSFGKGQVGKGYFAIDVTDPETADGGPKFLWQITKDANGNDLFGDGGAALITTVFLKSSDADPGKEVAVAVLPGGDAGARTGETTEAGPLMDTADETFSAATTVNEYDGAAAARSLTIVRLDTGEVVRSFRTPEVTYTLDTGVVQAVDIPAPIVGQPAAFPGATGSVADRIFVGDREGRIWRVDVSKSNPADWTMKVFFDAYFDKAVSKRQPIELAPIVSVDSVGQITVNAATGEQRIQTASTSMLNRVFSLTEVLSEENEFQAKVNWIESLGCDGTCGEGKYIGERVTGPMSLFGSSLYFASSTPAASTADQCATGSSRVWGLNYILSADEADDAETINPMNGAAGALPPPEGSLEPEKSTDPSEGVVFGVSIEQQPSCSTELEDFSGDPYLGNYGEHTSTSTVTPGKFFLVYQVGGVSGSESNKVTTEKVELTPPRNTVWVDSWAPIFE